MIAYDVKRGEGFQNNQKVDKFMFAHLLIFNFLIVENYNICVIKKTGKYIVYIL